MAVQKSLDHPRPYVYLLLIGFNFAVPFDVDRVKQRGSTYKYISRRYTNREQQQIHPVVRYKSEQRNFPDKGSDGKKKKR